MAHTVVWATIARLNNVTTKDSYPSPYLNGFANNLYGMTIFSAIDLQSAYHQVLMDPESIEKTTVTNLLARLNTGELTSDCVMLRRAFNASSRK